MQPEGCLLLPGRGANENAPSLCQPPPSTQQQVMTCGQCVVPVGWQHVCSHRPHHLHSAGTNRVASLPVLSRQLQLLLLVGLWGMAVALSPTTGCCAATGRCQIPVLRTCSQCADDPYWATAAGARLHSLSLHLYGGAAQAYAAGAAPLAAVARAAAVHSATGAAASCISCCPAPCCCCCCCWAHACC